MVVVEEETVIASIINIIIMFLLLLFMTGMPEEEGQVTAVYYLIAKLMPIVFIFLVVFRSKEHLTSHRMVLLALFSLFAHQMSVHPWLWI